MDNAIIQVEDLVKVFGLYATKRGSDLAISPFGVCQVTLQDPTSSQSTPTAA